MAQHSIRKICMKMANNNNNNNNSNIHHHRINNSTTQSTIDQHHHRRHRQSCCSNTIHHSWSIQTRHHTTPIRHTYSLEQNSIFIRFFFNKNKQNIGAKLECFSTICNLKHLLFMFHSLIKTFDKLNL